MKTKLLKTKEYLLLIDEEAEVCRGQHRFLNNEVELIHEGHNYPYKGNKVIAYYPLAKEAKEFDLPLLPNPFEGDVWVKGNRISVTTLYEYEERQDWLNHNKYRNLGYQTYIGEVIEVDKGLALKTDDGKIFKTQGTYWFGSILNQNCKLLKAAQSKQFTLEDMKKAIEMAQEEYYNEGGYQGLEYTPEQIIQSLSTQQLPKEFIMKKEPIYEERYFSEMSAYMPYCIGEKPWIITNSEGKKVLTGKWVY